MFGLDFLFAAGLAALPLAALPVLLHMLFRRKSPVIQFPTLRFIKSSIQQTAARKKIQRWILLACRILLLALLIFAIAQPVTQISAGWGQSTPSFVAAIVVDTTYSMEMKVEDHAVLDRANDTISELLKEPLAKARVAIFRSAPPAEDEPVVLKTAAEVLAQWKDLAPEPAGVPLAQRVSAAVKFLKEQRADQKWLIVLSDMQSREFPTPMPAFDEGRTILFDLRPAKPRNCGVSSIRLEPEQPIPGIGAQAVVELAGYAGEAHPVTLSLHKADASQGEMKRIGPLMATFDTTGRTRVRFALKEGLPPEPRLLIRATLAADDMQWDDQRTLLVELPPRQSVAFFDAPALPAASSFIRLALDPWEGKLATWPVELKRASDLSGNPNVAVIPLTQWPDANRAQQLRDFVRGGGTLILLLQPGLEQTWTALPPPQQKLLLELLPSAPAAALPGGGTAGSGNFVPAPPRTPDPMLAPLLDPSFKLNQLAVRRFVPLGVPSDPAVATLLDLSRKEGGSTAFGLLYRRQVGAGLAYTFATLPESRYMSPAAHPLFLPMLVSLSLPPAAQRLSQNVELGQSLSLPAAKFPGQGALWVVKEGTREQVPLNLSEKRFVFSKTQKPGLYTWQLPNDPQVAALGNVEHPGAESDPVYREAATVLATGKDHPAHLIARSFAEMKSQMAAVEQKVPQWSLPIVLVLMLFCFEALLGSLSELWKPVAWRKLIPGVSG